MDKEKVKLAVDHVFRDMAGAMSAGMAFVGTRTGLFRAMQGKGAMSVDQVTKASGLQPRYVEEWLKGMASAGYLQYENGKFSLADEYAYFLASYWPRLMRSSASTQSWPNSSKRTPPPFANASTTFGATFISAGTISHMPPTKWSVPSEARK